MPYGSSFPSLTTLVPTVSPTNTAVSLNSPDYYSVNILALTAQTVAFSSMQGLIFGTSGGPVTSSGLTAFKMSSAISIGGTSSSAFGISVKTADDTAYSKLSLGVLGCAQAYTVATLPSTSVAQQGDIAKVTDAVTGLAWGASGLGGSSNTEYIVHFNGSAWTVMGK